MTPIPEGFVLVPIEPTSDMMNSCPEAFHAWKRNDSGLPLQNLGIRIYRAMLAAAPLAPSPFSDKVGEALAELVACKELKDRLNRMNQLETLSMSSAQLDDERAMKADYERRKPLAWQAAREALK